MEAGVGLKDKTANEVSLDENGRLAVIRRDVLDGCAEWALARLRQRKRYKKMLLPNWGWK